MKVLIPENTILWTRQGLCFRKEITCRTEIFTIDSKNNLVVYPITKSNESEMMKVHTIITKNNICTIIPNYKIRSDKDLIPIKEITKNDNLILADVRYTKKFKDVHDENTEEFVDMSPFSVITALYLWCIWNKTT